MTKVKKKTGAPTVATAEERPPTQGAGIRGSDYASTSPLAELAITLTITATLLA
jgi:hypothetical protein